MTINLARLHEYPIVGLDVETTGTHWYRDQMFGIAIAVYDGQRIESDYWDIREKPAIMDVVRREIPRVNKLVNHMIKFDSHFVMNEKVNIPYDRIECTGVRAALIDEHEPSFSLDALCLKHIGKGKVDIWAKLAEMFGGLPTRGAQIKNLHRAPASLARQYAAPDPALAIELWLKQEALIAGQGLERIWSLERKLTPVLLQIERQGVRVDEQRAHDSMKAIDTKVFRVQRELNDLYGKEINVNSAPQMRQMFKVTKTVNDGKVEWRTDSGFLLENTDSNEASLDKDAMMAMAERGDRRAAHVSTIRRMLKAKSFLKDHIIGHAVGGRVYPNYNQTKNEHAGVGPGRLSIDDPALQQIPMHDRDVAEIVRPCFLPEKGQKWGCADWKQFEFRWFAHYVKDPGINAMYEKDPDADFHAVTAAITGITRDRKFAGDTANAKQINLGLVFGMGEGEMAYNMGMEYETIRDRNGRTWKRAGDKAKEVFRKYHDAVPGVRTLLDQAMGIAHARGYVKTLYDRHIRFPGGKFLHKAGGLTFQGTSADCMKLKMVELWPICQKEGWQYLVSVHDEHDVSVPAKQEKAAQKKLQQVLETFDGVKCEIKCRIPIRSDINFGDNWWEACS